MNFGEFYSQILSSVFPGKDSPRLDQRHRNAVMDALTRVQRYAKCYRNQHELIVRQDDTTFVGGISVFDRPQGQPWEVRIERLDAPQDFVLAWPYTFAQMRAVAETMGSCEQPVQCGPYVGEYGDYGDYYYPGECAPASTCVPSNYAVAMDDKSMYLYPAVHVCTRVVVSWSGIKRMWSDGDEIPWLDEDGFVDRDVFRAAEEYLRARAALDDDCNVDKGNAYMTLHMAVIAELNAICARRHEVVGPPILFPSSGSTRGACVLNEPVAGEEPPVTPRPEVATPRFNPPGGNYYNAPLVTIFTLTPDAEIYYTTNNTAPSRASIRYTGPFQVTQNVTLRAIAYKEGYRDSQPSQAGYTIAVPTVNSPIISPASGSYQGSVQVSITTATVGATLWYTDDGSTPIPNVSPRYNGPFILNQSRRITAIASKQGMNNSGLAWNDFTITMQKVATPVFTPPEGTYDVGQMVEITCTTPGAFIYYTEDGSEPTTGSTQYTVPIPVDDDKLIRARAFKDGSTPSDPAEAQYNIAGTFFIYLFRQAPGATGVPDFSSDIDATYQRTTITGSFEQGTINDGNFTRSIAWPKSEGFPRSNDGIQASTSGGPPLPLEMEEGGIFTEENNGWNAASATYNGVEYWVFRTVDAFGPNVEFTFSIMHELYIQETVETPVFSPPPGTYSGTQFVTITTATQGASIVYTTNGDLPDPATSPPYTGPIQITDDTLLSAVAWRARWVTSGLMFGDYVIGTPPLPTSPVHWGASPATVLDEAGVIALANRSINQSTPYRTYFFGSLTTVNDYFYFWWPTSFTPPSPGNGFLLGTFPVAMATGGDYDQSVNGWSYKNLTVNGVAGRLWRTFQKLGGGGNLGIIVQ